MFDSSKTAGLEMRSREEIRELQSKLLVEHLAFLGEWSPFYSKRLSELGVDPLSVRGVDDLSKLPFTTKDDLAGANKDFLCVDESEIVDVCVTSGTTGQPVVLMQTRRDLERLGYNEEISFLAAGVTPHDRVAIATALDRCFMAGLAYFMGLERIGASAIRAGSSSMSFLAEMILMHRPTAMVGVPSQMLALAGMLAERGKQPAEIGIKKLIGIGEPVREQDLSLSSLGEKLAKAWNAEVFGTYASTEMATAFCDCQAQAGGHLHPDLIIVEIVDEEGNPVGPGSVGEVVATPLRTTGMPLLRFKTGDMAALHVEPCACGRNSPRLGPILGRKKQMLKCRGTTVFPQAVSAALQEMDEIKGHYIEVYSEFDLSDRIRVVAGTNSADISASAVAEKIAAKTRVKPEVVLTSPESVMEKIIQKHKRKPVTFFDYRGAGQ